MITLFNKEKNIFRKIWITFWMVLCTTYAISQDTSPLPQSLDELMKFIQTERVEQRKEFQQRYNQFMKKQNNQQQMLNQLKAELRKEETIQKNLQKQYEANEKELGKLEEELTIIQGTLGELFGVVKQIAGDLHGEVLNSIVSAQIKNREVFLNKVLGQNKLPNIQQIRRLWLELQLEMTELGNVRKFKEKIILPNGDPVQKEIIRVGGFNLVHDGEYLAYQNETNQIVKLPSQPSGKFLKYIHQLESSTDPNQYSAFALDPSRGSLLSVLLRKTSLWGYIVYGGWVGAVIIFILLFGLGIVIFKWVVLHKEEKNLKIQLESQVPDASNPIGKIRLAFEQNQHQDIETLELKLDEVIVQSRPIFEKGIPTIKIFSAIAPLLGLLGTVVGMIVTFQSITLFGTGDPKLMAGGISQALVTTVLGLCCAIPLLLCHHFISSKSNKLIQILEEQVAGLLAKKVNQ